MSEEETKERHSRRRKDKIIKDKFKEPVKGFKIRTLKTEPYKRDHRKIYIDGDEDFE